MSPRRAVTVLAMLAALVMAPSSLFAAAPNELRSPAITPLAGTTATLFELSVGYSGDDPANAVTATVAGKTVALRLSSGSSRDGTWTEGTLLPVGSWMVTFRANASQGRDPKPLIFGPIIVSPGVTQPPSTPITSQPSDGTEPGETSPTVEPKPRGSAAPSSSGNPAQAGASTEPSGGAAAAASKGPSASEPKHGEAPRDRTAGARGSSSPDGGAAPAQPTASAGTDTGGGSQAVGRELAGMVLLFGIGGVAAVALLGAAWILIATRRDRAEPSVAALPTLDPAVPATSPLPSVERRARRRARLRPSDDPILAALGLHDEQQPLPDEDSGEAGGRPRRFRRAARK
jgi:hypothetical protein